MTVVYGVLVVCGASLAAVAGLMLVERLVPATTRKEHNDVAGFIYAALALSTPCCWRWWSSPFGRSSGVPALR
jgi:hypothetical protein